MTFGVPPSFFHLYLRGEPLRTEGLEPNALLKRGGPGKPFFRLFRSAPLRLALFNFFPSVTHFFWCDVTTFHTFQTNPQITEVAAILDAT